jgi:putative alpha-1,2-mannosidase
MGFYPLNPADGIYQIGTPQFNKVTLHLQGGKTFTVIAENKAGDNYLVKSATLNGSPLDRWHITHQEILNGGTLQLNY